ncbi:hypothetical protein ABB37_00316 [Leptomonas pyrrhocoris]|uniref:Uncharacterized protein n=1 Tax=Leptomonas pyrrhocoris TaxID=157538 RepID=A0A0N0VHW9_LEPPY|nr:hypothetical protein ABB37_00316 [Leptomonas pyrrhocoris]XP_015664484.1 hypothetical protein ABB37_00316 [Leptomonas pyrrhocoris]KPA86044.1 hypothetical protein ABB37_00316 [Leptomonas pyrrhocoris]KPA86045.1 hypothetical protein ABB37_00316 [Leptomonas pyrrhocoris]|eukprot:XP_015664483.1 hypothetical protein ABB37_00316 [Leptomonas pyrrhocoris]
MSDAPFETANSGNDELERPKTDVLETGGGSSSGHQSKKMGAIRNFFKHSPSNADGITPRSEGASARAAGGGGSSHHATVSRDDDFEDHMLGSAYKCTDICKACGFPRGSSVCCPVTHLHHGTDEATTSAKRHHGRTFSGGRNLMARIRDKLPLTPGRRSNRHGSNDGGGEERHTPQTEEGQAMSVTAYPGPDAAEEVPLSLEHTMSPLNPQLDGAGGDANLDAYVSGDSPVEAVPEEETQYYCYTDENGDTFYYTQELRESMHDAVYALPQRARVEGDGDAGDEAADATGAAVAAADLPPGTCVYQYIDENGETVNCLCTPQAGGDPPAADQQEGDAQGGATPTTSAVAHAGSDPGNSSETDDPSASRKKSTHSFFSAVQNVFKPHRGTHAHSQSHEDPLNMADASTPVRTPSGGATLEGTTTDLATAMPGCVEAHEYDADVVAFMELLDDSEKKRFIKERKNLIKDLSASEKKDRDAIMKNRQDGMAAFRRDKLAAAFSIRKDERTIKSGQKRGEPL